jgi:hypothetical protein
VLDVMVIRLALVYDRSCLIWPILFESIYSVAKSGSPSASVAVELSSRPGLIHVDDVATGVHAAIDKLPLIPGTGVYPGFDLVSSQQNMKDILMLLGEILASRGYWG